MTWSNRWKIWRWNWRWCRNAERPLQSGPKRGPQNTQFYQSLVSGNIYLLIIWSNFLIWSTFLFGNSKYILPYQVDNKYLSGSVTWSNRWRNWRWIWPWWGNAKQLPQSGSERGPQNAHFYQWLVSWNIYLLNYYIGYFSL